MKFLDQFKLLVSGTSRAHRDPLPERVGATLIYEGRPRLRGRVMRVSVTKSTDISVVVRFGIEELDRVKQMMPGTVLEVVEVPNTKAKEDEKQK